MLGYLYRILIGCFTICRHPKWLFIEGEKPRQVCETCGWSEYIKEASLGKEDNECRHKWKQETKVSITRGEKDRHVGYFILDVCEKCGERKSEKHLISNI